MPPKNFVDITGKKFGRLTVEKRLGNNKSGAATWICRCDCGGEATATTGSLKIGNTGSCGCKKLEMLVVRSTTHGLTGGHGKYTRPYRIWLGMRGRCLNEKNQDFRHYGGRGITVCEEWNDYGSFHSWAMESGYRSDLTLDRKDNNGNHGPDNCSWATRKQQSRNSRQVRLETFEGATRSIGEWGEVTGVGSAVIRRRIKLGWTIRRALTEPPRKQPSGKEKTV